MKTVVSCALLGKSEPVSIYWTEAVYHLNIMSLTLMSALTVFTVYTDTLLQHHGTVNILMYTLNSFSLIPALDICRWLYNSTGQ